MLTTSIETTSLTLVLQTPDEVRALIDGMAPHVRAELSPDWLARVEAATSPDPWTHGFALVQRAGHVVVGHAGFKGPPAGGMVEIAYGVDPQYQGRGYATEAAKALAAYAFRSGQVRIVRAHTRADATASTRVLTKCGFRRLGEVMDPEDGLVWRWEKSGEAG